MSSFHVQLSKHLTLVRTESLIKNEITPAEDAQIAAVEVILQRISNHRLMAGQPAGKPTGS